jgi:hypothetical protein
LYDSASIAAVTPHLRDLSGRGVSNLRTVECIKFCGGMNSEGGGFCLQTLILLRVSITSPLVAKSFAAQCIEDQIKQEDVESVYHYIVVHLSSPLQPLPLLPGLASVLWYPQKNTVPSNHPGVVCTGLFRAGTVCNMRYHPSDSVSILISPIRTC